MDRSAIQNGVRKPYENNYTKTYEGNTWRGAQDGSVERYGQKPAPRFQGTNPQYNGHQNGHQSEIVPNGTDGKPVRQSRPNTYQNRQNGTYVPRTNNPAVNGGHQGPYAHQGVNPTANGYQGNRGKPEVCILINFNYQFFLRFFLDPIQFFNQIHFLRRVSIKIVIQIIAIKAVQLLAFKPAPIIIAIHMHSNQMLMA